MNHIPRIIVAATATLLLSTTIAIAQEPQTPSFDITPGEGQVIYGNKIPVLVATENFDLIDYKESTLKQAGKGHVHIWLDEQNPTVDNSVQLTTDVFTYSDVTYGEHTLTAELVNNDHTPLVPPVKKIIKFQNQPVSSPNPAQATGFDKKTGLVILAIVALVIIAAWWYTKDEDEEEGSEGAKVTKSTKVKKTTKKAPKKRK